MAMKKILKEKYSDIYVREDANISNSMEEHKDIFSFKKSSNAAIDYKNLVNEFLYNEVCINKKQEGFSRIWGNQQNNNNLITV